MKKGYIVLIILFISSIILTLLGYYDYFPLLWVGLVGVNASIFFFIVLQLYYTYHIAKKSLFRWKKTLILLSIPVLSLLYLLIPAFLSAMFTLVGNVLATFLLSVFTVLFTQYLRDKSESLNALKSILNEVHLNLDRCEELQHLIKDDLEGLEDHNLVAWDYPHFYTSAWTSKGAIVYKLGEEGKKWGKNVTELYHEIQDTNIYLKRIWDLKMTDLRSDQSYQVELRKILEKTQENLSKIKKGLRKAQKFVE